MSMRLKKQVCRCRSISKRRAASEVLNGQGAIMLLLIMAWSRFSHRNAQANKSIVTSVSKGSPGKQNQ